MLKRIILYLYNYTSVSSVANAMQFILCFCLLLHSICLWVLQGILCFYCGRKLQLIIQKLISIKNGLNKKREFFYEYSLLLICLLFNRHFNEFNIFIILNKKKTCFSHKTVEIIVAYVYSLVFHTHSQDNLIVFTPKTWQCLQRYFMHKFAKCYL